MISFAIFKNVENFSVPLNYFLTLVDITGA